MPFCTVARLRKEIQREKLKRISCDSSCLPVSLLDQPLRAQRRQMYRSVSDSAQAGLLQLPAGFRAARSSLLARSLLLNGRASSRHRFVQSSHCWGLSAQSRVYVKTYQFLKCLLFFKRVASDLRGISASICYTSVVLTLIKTLSLTEVDQHML